MGAESIVGTAVALWGAHKASQQEKQQEELIKNRPKYNINSEAGTNQAIAGNQAAYANNQLYGQDQTKMLADQQVDANMANGVNAAQQSSNSTAGILSAIAGMNTGANQAKRQNAIDASGRLQDKQGLAMQANSQLMGANNAMIDEKDKAWNFNVNEPYQNLIAMKRDKGAYFRSMQNQGVASMQHGFASDDAAMSNMMGGMMCFDACTPVQMADGTTKNIIDVRIGDLTAGGEATSLHQFKAGLLMNYDGVLVSFYHAVKEDGEWVRVGHSKRAKETDVVALLYNLTTSDRRIFVNGIEFADYAELQKPDLIPIYEYSLEVLNSRI